MFLCWGGGGAVNYVHSFPIHKCVRWDMIFLQSISMILYSRTDQLGTRNLDSAARCYVGMEVAASVLMRRHSDEPMARSGMEWTSEIGFLWESLMGFLLQVYICC